MDVSLFLHSMAGLFAIMNPFVALPMFLALTDGAAIREQRRAALRVVLYTLVLTAVVFGSGTAVLRFFGIGITAFRIAGGIVLLVIGLSMLDGTGSSAHTGTKGEQEHLSQTPDVAFYPMAFPVIAGPGTITTLVILTGQAKGAAGYALHRGGPPGGLGRARGRPLPRGQHRALPLADAPLGHDAAHGHDPRGDRGPDGDRRLEGRIPGARRVVRALPPGRSGRRTRHGQRLACVAGSGTPPSPSGGAPRVVGSTAAGFRTRGRTPGRLRTRRRRGRGRSARSR